MQFWTEISQPVVPFRLDYSHPVGLMGSCFADNIGNKLSQIWWPSLVNPLGITYNPISLFTQIGWVLEKGQPSSNRWIKQDEKWVHLDLHTKFSGPSRNELEEQIENVILKTHAFLSTARILVISLGSSVVFEYREDGQVVSNCHKIPSSQFEKRTLSVQEIIGSGNEIISAMLKKYSDLHLIFTVSPVRHTRHGLSQNNLSKSILLQCVHAWAEQSDRVQYFPSYELMMDVLRDYRWYADDLIHPNSQAVDYIFEFFKKTWVSSHAIDLMKKIGKLRSSMMHHSSHAESKAHLIHKEHTLQRVNDFVTAHPKINDSEASSYLSNPDAWHQGKLP